jgi:hypothetical protein
MLRAMPAGVIGEARSLGIAVLGGAIAGAVVGGIGGRLVMRLIATRAGPGAQGASTANGNIVGLVTIDGTVALIVFGGLAFGIIGGLVYRATDPWLRRTGRWRPLAFGVALFAVLGFTVIDPANPDFRSFGDPTANVALFAAVFVSYGALVTWLVATLERHTPSPSGIPRRGLVGNGLVLLVAGSTLLAILLLGSLLATTALLLSGAPAQTGFGLTNGLVLLGIIAAGALSRVLADPWQTVAVAVPLLAGTLLSVRSIAAVLGAGA